MKIADSYNARKELEAAIGKIKAAFTELQKPDITQNEKFDIAWSLAFIDLQTLENFRCPKWTY